MAASIQQGKGTLGQLVASDALYTKVDSTVTRVDDVLAAVQQQKGSLGKFIYDPAFHDNANQFLNGGNALIADVRAGRGTLGKLATDDSLFTMLRETSQNVRDATRQAEFQSDHGREDVFRSAAVRQSERPDRRSAPARGRVPPRPEEVPARELFDFLAGRGSSLSVMSLAAFAR